MATSFKKTPHVNPLTKFGEKSTADNLYWNNLDVPITKKEYGNITHIEFNPVSPYNYAVTNSTRVQIYSSRSNQIVRSLNRFNEAANCGSFRSDGKLLVAGSDDKMVRLFEPTGRTLLRVFKGHKEAVLVTRFLADNQRIMSASRDRSVRLWDIPSEAQVANYNEFKDYVKCGVVSQSSPDIFLTGAYDHTAKLFDARTQSSVMTVDHGHPIESVLLFPTNGVFITAGSNIVKVWDALAGGRQLTQMCHHHKTVMSLCFCSQYRRFMSASSDRHVKVYDVSSYQAVHSLDYPANILSIAVAPDDSVVVVGMEGGLLSIQHRNKSETKAKDTKKKKETTFHYKFKHMNFKADRDDLVITNQRKEKMARYDNLLKRFEHSKALDAAMEPHVRSQMPEVTMGVLQELARRGTLKAALAGRDTRQVEALLKFIQRNMWKPNYSHMTDLLNVVLDLYEGEIAGNVALESSVSRVMETGDCEQAYDMELVQIKGMLEGVFSVRESALAATSATPQEGKEKEREREEAILSPSAAAVAVEVT